MSAELRWHPLARRWVVIAVDREGRPFEYGTELGRTNRAMRESRCPFCPGNELETLPAVEWIDDDAGGWSLRVVPNKYPSFEGDGPAVAAVGEVGACLPSSGCSEVVVFTSQHDLDLGDLDEAAIVRLFEIFGRRREVHAQNSAVRHTSMVVNRGAGSGASIRHAHAQLLSTPFVPPTVEVEVQGFEYVPDLIDAAFGADAQSVIDERERAVVGCPNWSLFPYETWIVPRERSPIIDPSDQALLFDVASLLIDTLRHHRAVLGDVDYNVIVRVAPHDSSARFHWYVQVVPRHIAIAGFELSSGISVNAVAPELAAERLRAVS